MQLSSPITAAGPSPIPTEFPFERKKCAPEQASDMSIDPKHRSRQVPHPAARASGQVPFKDHAGLLASAKKAIAARSATSAFALKPSFSKRVHLVHRDLWASSGTFFSASPLESAQKEDRNRRFCVACTTDAGRHKRLETQKSNRTVSAKECRPVFPPSPRLDEVS